MLGVLSPLLSFWILVLWGPKLGKPLSGWTAVVLGMGVPLVLASYVLVSWWWGETEASRTALSAAAWRLHWADLGGVPATFGVKLDSLTVAMYFMVAFIAFWIFFFSIGYMSGHSDEVAGQCKYWRFFAYLSLFGFSMLGLVISSSLLFLFIFWELVGLCSYLLIGFYFHERWPQYAQMKAFITNRVGDFGFLIGLMLVYTYLGTLDLDEAAARFAEQAASRTGLFASSFTLWGASLATIMGIGLFCGAMGKSAQFPLHVWLPDAMAGPTPVSALIHAATMVAAGVYLVARVFRLMTPEALMFIALIGCLTLTLMALVAIVQVDIKKCLAYSTLSQLGYMIFGMGCGAWVAALFHLITHAFFKAMLFLCSGQVIEGCHHVQDMRKMGGLRKKMPVTCWTFFVGVLAISGAGIAGTGIGIGGFFSKDEILAVAYARSYVWGNEDFEKHQAAHYEEHALRAVPD
ncbi:MAG: NADH-quinone oxidoreductase subunit L, partial [Planctomycetota bacterium]